MGICPSRCGEKQPSAAVAPVVLPVTATLETKLTPSPYDPNHSLKRFLHLNQDPQTTSAISTPRTSLVESTALPHSSELFSLPGSELELRSSFALSPTGTPKRRAPSDGALMSSEFTRKSPRKGRDNSNNSNKRLRPAARGECFDLAAHQRLVDAIARLERLNDAKMASGPGFQASGSSELKNAAMRSRHVRHYQLPLPKNSTISSTTTAPFPHPSICKPDENPAATDFLLETFASLIEPREARDSKATFPLNGTKSCRFENIDGEEMLTFEFGPSGVRDRSKQSPVRKKSVLLQRLLQSGTQASSGRRFARAEEEDMASACSTWQPIEEFLEPKGMVEKTGKTRVSGEPERKSLREEDSTAMRKATSPGLAFRMTALKGLKRGRLSQSFDSIESSTIHVDLEIFRKRGATPIAVSRLNTFASPNKHSTEVPATLLDAKRTELEMLQVSSELESFGGEQRLDVEENCCTGVSDDSTNSYRGFIDGEIRLPQVVVSQVEDPIPSPRDPAGNLGVVPESNNPDMVCEESARTECTKSEPPHTGRKVVLHTNYLASQWLALLETSLRLLKILFFNTERVGADCQVATRGSDEENEQENVGLN